MARLRGVLHHPRVLADDPSLCGSVARPKTLSLYSAVARVGRDVVPGRANHEPVAERESLPNKLVVGSYSATILRRNLYLLAIRKRLHRETTRRPSRSPRQESRSATSHRWNPRPSSPSNVSRTPLRNAGLERRHRTSRFLGIDRVRSPQRSDHDPHRRSRIRDEIWRTVSRVPELRACNHTEHKKAPSYNPV